MRLRKEVEDTHEHLMKVHMRVLCVEDTVNIAVVFKFRVFIPVHVVNFDNRNVPLLQSTIEIVSTLSNASLLRIVDLFMPRNKAI